MGGRAAIIFQKPVEESSGGVEVVNPVWGTNRCLPRHTSTKTLGRQTALVYLSTRSHSHSPGPVTGGGGGWEGEGGVGGGEAGRTRLSTSTARIGQGPQRVARYKQYIDCRATPHCATKLWLDKL